jgi:hypothetical protein
MTEAPRQSGMLSDYRMWRSGIVSDWQRNGKIDTNTERELRRAVRRVLQELGIDAQQSDYKIGFNLIPYRRGGYREASVLDPYAERGAAALQTPDAQHKSNPRVQKAIPSP